MRSHRPQEGTRSISTLTKQILVICLSLLCFCGHFSFMAPAFARSATTPWTDQVSFQNLVYGSSSTNDVVLVMGAQPDDIVRSEQMYPVVENYYYYDKEKSGGASVFVFENGLLVGLELKTATNQMIDLTSFLPNNGDRLITYPALGGYQQYYPYYAIPTITTSDEPW
jgi:hypothetical protein